MFFVHNAALTLRHNSTLKNIHIILDSYNRVKKDFRLTNEEWNDYMKLETPDERQKMIITFTTLKTEKILAKKLLIKLLVRKILEKMFEIEIDIILDNIVSYI